MKEEKIWLHNPQKNDNMLYYRRRNGIIVEHMLRPAAYQMQHNHVHPEYELNFLMHGRRQMFVGNRSYVMEEGTLALVDSNRIHMANAVEGDPNAYYERIILYIGKEKVEEYDSKFPELEIGSFFQQYDGIYVLSPEERQRVMQMFDTVKQELDGGQEKSQTLIDLTIIGFFIDFWRSRRPAGSPAGEQDQQKKGKPSVAYDASEYILAHFCEQIRLEDLAERFLVSESYLSRSFKDVIGVGITEYINILRIRKAQELLEDSKLSIAEIAQTVGFENASYFGRVFQKHLAIPPSRYRKDLSVRKNTGEQTGHHCERGIVSKFHCKS